MERTNFINARKEKGMRQADFAEVMGVNRATVSAWENATQDPHPDLWPKIRGILDSNDPELFKIFDDQESNERLFNACRSLLQEPNGGLLDAFRSLLQKSNEELIDVFELVLQQELYEEFMDSIRRLIVDTLAKMGGSSLIFGGTDLSRLSSPVIAPEEYLAQCCVAIDACWEWLNQGHIHKVERALNTHMPTLTRFASALSHYQGMAANLAVQAKIMQALLATQKLDFIGRETHCVEAVRFGQLSGNRDILAMALNWYGNTYTVCYSQPQKAIAILNDALSVLNSESSLLTRSAIYSNLSIAYTQDNTQDNFEIQARNYIEMAHVAMPTHPELAPLYECIQWNHSELDALEGNVYLHLAEHFPNGGYAQKAYDTLDQSTSKQALDRYTRGGTLIRKADAALALGEMRHFINCLEQGLLIAIEINSKRRISGAHDVMQRIPGEWQKETAIKNLQKDISRAIVVARR